MAPARAAYVTFLAGTGDYWKGVVGLAKGLRAVKSAYPLVVAVLPDVPEAHRRALLSQGCVVREVQPVYPPESQTRFAWAYYIINYSKLRIWELVEYERMVYLDADVQVYENIDHLFDLEVGHLYAVKDCFCEGMKWSEQCQDRAAFWPEPPLRYFNAGVFVHEPSLATAQALLDRLAISDPTAFAEQDFLNMFFRDEYKPIPAAYNLLLAMLWRHPESVELGKAKVVHYCAEVRTLEAVLVFS
jgi:inositol 3-alpha-galactosyltransferase